MRPPALHGRSIRTVLAAVAVAGLAAGLSAPVAAAPADPAPPGLESEAKIDPQLKQRLGADDTADFVVTFDQHSDLSDAAEIDDWAARGDAVVDALRETAESSQRAVRRQLDAAGVKYRAFHISNAIYVFDGTDDVADRLAGRSEVAGLTPARSHRLPEPERTPATLSTQDVEWGIADIRADEVWSDVGVSGEDIVVASIDSGVQFDHPAVVGQYRGNNGDGTFDHEYNWYDPEHTCAGVDAEPCDNDGHGTHVTGTMAGDTTGTGDGAQIGVAPGARWIAAKACEGRSCSGFALLSSAEWLLAPTDAEGQNPRPDLRPHVINNSWGASNGSTVDPWFDDVIRAWIAAGIFPAFSNGNSGPACDTASTPGDSVLSYSAGMHDVNGVVDPDSSRGPGGPEIKPNISAPGVNIRSAVPGDAYENWRGTSMASPHVAGSVALLWAAAPLVRGDIAATRDLLDGAAADVDDTSCGGTADDNNVYGEGHLDVYAAVTTAPRGDAGTLSGTVTDGGTGDPVAGATVEFTGSGERTVTTSADGTYAALLAVGDYDVDVTAFGYEDVQASASVTVDTTTTLDVALDPLPTAVLSGTVTEGSEHGWPLYATLTVDGVPDGTYHSDPDDGSYRIELPVGSTYSVTVDAAYPGHRSYTADIDVAGDTTHDVALATDPYACTAPGYEPRERDVTHTQTFDPDTAPEGWSVVDHIGNGQVWQFPHDDRNRTGGEGNFASVFSARYGRDGRQDTDLVSPVIDLSDTATPALWFKTDYSSRARIGIDLSVDGGQTWQNVWHYQGGVGIYGEERRVPIPAAAGEADARVRFTFESAFSGWWQVDDVMFGERNCATVAGGLVVGHVLDANTTTPIVGATVSSADDPALSVPTTATPDDETLDDGFYWMFVPDAGEHELTGTRTRYEDTTTTVDVAGDGATRADISLPAGLLAFVEDDLNAAAELGGTDTATVTVTNDGSAPAELDITERPGSGSPAALTGSGGPVQRIEGEYATGREAVTDATATGAGTTAQAPIAPWALLADYPLGIWDNAVGFHDGRVYSFGGATAGGAVAQAYVYSPDDASWETIATMPRARQRPMGGFLNGKFYAAGGWSSTGAPRLDVDVYDPHTNTWSAGPPLPEQFVSAGSTVLDDMLYVVGGCRGDCGETTVIRLDPVAGQWEPVADYPEPAALLSCGGIDHKLYCAGGVEGEIANDLASAYVYDPQADTWTRLSDMPMGLWGSATTVADGRLLVSGGVTDGDDVLTNEGFAYDPGTDTWSPIPNAPVPVYRAGSACGFHTVGGNTGGMMTPTTALLPGYADCGTGDAVSWMSLDTPSLTLDPGESAQVTVTFDAASLTEPGEMTAALVLRDDTPYDATALPVTFAVTAPEGWGELTGPVLGQACDGSTTPLPGAVIRIDSAAGTRTLISDHEGRYAAWFDRAANPLDVVVVATGWPPQTERVRVRPNRPTVLDFTLRQGGCER